MKIITNKEVKFWLKDRNIFDVNEKIDWKIFPEYGHFLIPKDTGRKTVFSRQTTSMLFSSSECLIWIREYGIWPSSQNMELFKILRRFTGDSRELHEAPGHICTKQDIKEVESLLDLILYFYWGALIIGGKGEYAINISHDEVVEVGGEEEFVKSVTDILAKNT